MSPRITTEQRTALNAHEPGHPVEVFDDVSQRTFWLVSPEDVPALWVDHVHHEVQRGLDAIDRGEIVAWDPDAMKARARAANQRHQSLP